MLGTELDTGDSGKNKTALACPQELTVHYNVECVQIFLWASEGRPRC